YADLLRIRGYGEGGAAALAYLHKSLELELPYDELAKRLITAGGKANHVPEVGFILGDGADPMALAATTSQVFLGIRVSCAQCHDHPFDKWKQKDFYGLAAYFGKTQRVESQFTKTIYTVERDQTVVLWPPEGATSKEPRRPMVPTFLYPLDSSDSPRNHVARLTRMRQEKEEALALASKGSAGSNEIDDLLASAAEKAAKRTTQADDEPTGVVAEAKKEARGLKINAANGQTSELRQELAAWIADPRNGYFSRNLVNRVWDELIGKGIVNPIDDFADTNPASHPETLAYLADEFVAHGFDLKWVVREIVLSDTYCRSHDFSDQQSELEEAFLATPMRRLRSEALYDSIIVAGHLFDVKHAAGKNKKVVWTESKLESKKKEGLLAGEGQAMPLAKAAMDRPDSEKTQPGYNLESAISVDFDALLAASENGQDDTVEVEKMAVMSNEEIEAMRMAAQMKFRREVDYIDRFVRAEIDDNPRFDSSLKMVSPADPEHFVRVFGQTDRSVLGEHRDSSPTMRQALMMLNGRLTHEASRVGELEPIHDLVEGKKSDLPAAIRMAYVDILTRQPSAEETKEGLEIVKAAKKPLEGIADLRWLLLNCNEFRFLR
ncbi:MAG: DUF1553 domain-containing protein, partial [Planctomycetes bacterium]|nr:DUF1553 domain-containing protein [Planctomycetota bacterium]